MALHQRLRFAALATSFLLPALLQTTLSAQPPAQPAPIAAEKPFFLHDGDTVVFYGDSITEQRFYTHWIEVYAVTRFPHMPLQFFSEGIGGDRVTGGDGGPIDLRLSRDVIPHKPTVVTIMLGMNDGGYKPLTPEIEATYTQGYEHILSSLETSLPGVRFSLFGPSPYDEVTRPEMFPGGYNSTLVRFAQIDSALAAKHNGTFVDLNAPFVAALKRGALFDYIATQILLPDRVHPEQLAHWFMAAAILKGWNAPAIVSSTTLDASSLAASDLQGSHVSEIAGDPTHLTWTELDDALPLPLDDKHIGNHFIRQLFPLDDQLNQQPLVVHNLKPGSYSLAIDGMPTGTFTDVELSKGINLALYGTPMRGQAYRVSWKIRDRDDTEYVRLRMLVNEMKTSVPAEPTAAGLAQFETLQLKQIYETAQPIPHKYSLNLVPSTLF